MKIALAQINTTVGNLEGNVERCLQAIKSAAEEKPALIVLPELAITGYPPRDILYDPSFVEAAGNALSDLARRAASYPPVLVGNITPSPHSQPQHPGLYNAAFLLKNGTFKLIAAKQLLPTYDVFYETRWFVPGPTLAPLEIADHKIGVLICEDLWDEGYPTHPPAELQLAGADMLICISASPYRQGVLAERLYHARRAKCPLIYLNLCGATDELIFDGQSFVINEKGELTTKLPAFEEVLEIVDLNKASPIPLTETNAEADLFEALVLGVRDFAQKNGLKQAVLGLSGGIDSAVTAVIAAKALGAEHVTGVAIPSRFNDPRSTRSAESLARKLGLNFEVIDLEPLHRAAITTLGDLLNEGTGAENIQVRLRMAILMSYVNKYGGFLLNTSNKTELSLGYATLYGDMAGALCPLADVTKAQVMALAQWINRTETIIPAFTLERPPSAELKAEQVDPFDYATVSPAIEAVVQANQSNGPLRRSEHKRWQMGIILKVSQKAFGTGRLVPVTRR